MTFVRNAWYVAGWSHEFETGLFSRTILGEAIAFFRKSDNSWAAISNRCPHRFAPLDKGKVINGNLRCGYHGLQFDEHGACVHNPIGNGNIPRTKKLQLRAYPVIEKYKLIWVWTGAKELANPSLIPDYSIHVDSEWVHAGGGYLHCNANYLLVVDNLMDLSHVAFLHPQLGTEEMSKGTLDVSMRDDATIQSKFFMSGIESPSFFEPHYKTGSKIDHWLDMRWNAPSNMLLNFGATEVGKSRHEGVQGLASHILTPETETTAHYFFGANRPLADGAEEVVATDHEAQKIVFSTEDKPMFEACQELMGTTDLWSLNPLLLSSDAAAVRARRVVDRIIRQENEATQTS